MVVSPAGRNDADNFFTMPVLSVRMHHHQDGPNSRFDGDSANCVPSLLAGLIDPVDAYQAALILKDQRRQLE
jgi:hypothetical protein